MLEYRENVGLLFCKDTQFSSTVSILYLLDVIESGLVFFIFVEIWKFGLRLHDMGPESEPVENRWFS